MTNIFDRDGETDIEKPKFIRSEGIRHAITPKKRDGKWHYHIPKYFEPKEKQPRKNREKTSTVKQCVYMALATRPCTMQELKCIVGKSRKSIETALKEIRLTNKVYTVCAGKETTYELAR